MANENKEKVEKRSITAAQYDWLRQELTRFHQEGIINSQQLEAMLSNYQVKEKMQFVRVLLMIGAILIGTGILSFIAANWDVIPKAGKFILILIGLIGSYFTGWLLEKEYPKTSKSFYYIGLIIFGAGIFLIGQMFHFTSEAQQAFLAWACGAIPLAWYLKDRWVAMFSIILMWSYSTSLWYMYGDPNPIFVWLFIPLLYWINHQVLNKSKMVFVFNTALLIFTIWDLLEKWELHSGLISLIFIIIGIIAMYLPIPAYKKTLQNIGLVIHGTAAIFLTLSWNWKVWEELFHTQAIGYLVVLAYFAFLIYLLRKGSLVAVVISCAFILRYYFDLSFDFLPKSLYFLIGGLLLVACGFWIERSRKKGGK